MSDIITRVIELLKPTRKREKREAEISPELERYNYLVKEIQNLKMALVGENLDGIPSGVLRILIKQNQDIYWAIKEDEMGKEIADMIKQLISKVDNLRKQEILETVREEISKEIQVVEEEQLRKKITELLQEYERLTSTDISILTGISNEDIDDILKKLVYEGLVKKESSGKFIYYTLLPV